MAITKLSTEQIDNIVNEAYAQSVGTEDVAEIDLTRLTDEGTSDVAALREKYTGKLLGVLSDTKYLQTSAESEYSDPFYQDEEEFGAIVQMISASVPEAIENKAWQDFVSGETKVGQYTVYLPTIDTSYYTKQTAWSIPITLTGEQWNQAFKDRTGLRRFTDFLRLVLNNAILKHRENMNELNRNNFIAQKFQSEATGVHTVDLIALYANERGITGAYTIAEAMASDDFKAFAMSKLGEYAAYMRKQNSLFTADNSVKFTPLDRLVVQVLDKFDRAISVTKAGIYHNEFIKMPNYQTVAAWQGLDSLNFNGVSEINVKTSAGEFKKSGIVAIMVDKWAILHTIVKRRVASQRFEIEDLTHYEYQFVDKYLNNLNMPGIIFYMADKTA